MEAILTERSDSFDVELCEDAERAFLAQVTRGRPSNDAKWRYANTLVDSPRREQIEEGLVLLQELLDAGERPGECLFSIAVGQFRLGHLSSAREHVERLMRREPGNSNAQLFHKHLIATAHKDGAQGLMMLAGIAVVTVASALLLRSRMSGASSSGAAAGGAGSSTLRSGGRAFAQSLFSGAPRR